MRIRLERLGDEPFTWQETLEVNPADLDRDELRGLGPITLNGRISRMPTGFWYEAALAFEQTLSCMRCLGAVCEPATVDHALLIEVEDTANPKGATESELSADDLGVLTLREPIFDTESLLTEQLQLNIPMKPLCREDCAGLCATCGANLNGGPCGCEAPIDPRWQALAALRGGDRSDSGD